MGITEDYLGEPVGEPGFVCGEKRREGEVLVRRMGEWDLERILRLRTVVRWSADPDAFGLLRGMRDARWAVADAGGYEGEIVGMVGPVPLGQVGILCHLAVHDSYRRTGVGARLTSWAVSYLRSRGVGVVRLDSTEAAERLYTGMGFEPVLRRTVYRMEEATTAARGAREGGGYRVSTLTIGDLPEVYGLDRWSFGGDRSALILAAIRLHPGRGLVARDGSGRIKGYLVRSVCGGKTLIGPLLAEGDEAMRALLTAALEAIGESGGGAVEITCARPHGEPEHLLLRESGFEPRPDRLRMELGAAPESRGVLQYGTTPYLAT
ncbi:MAG: GNAT family N-acetyltransferase [Rubrobacter sp.]|nr:GNAT family N-acetyltransferase [Rubrobacter sp.]